MNSVLGTEGPTKESDYKQHFKPLELPKGQREELEAVKKRNKVESTIFVDDGKYFSSVYNENHNKNRPPGFKGGYDPTELKKHLKELRSSHIQFGVDGEHFASESMQNYGNKLGTYAKAGPPMDLMQTHFYPGDDPMPTQSLYRNDFNKKEFEKVELN